MMFVPITVILTVAIVTAAAQESAFAGSTIVRRMSTKDLADMLKSAFEEEGDGENIVFEYDEGSKGEEDEVVVVKVNDNNEEEILADFIIEQKKSRGSNENDIPSHSRPVVKWDKESRKSNPRLTGPRSRGKEDKRKNTRAKEEKHKNTRAKEDKNKEIGRSGINGTSTPVNISTPKPTKFPSHRLTGTPTAYPSKKPAEHTKVEIERSSILPPCPPHYDTSVTYKAGDTIENKGYVWKCRHTPFEKYCSISKMNDSWSDEKKELWHSAWAHVNKCELQRVVVIGGQDTRTNVINNSTVSSVINANVSSTPTSNTTEALAITAPLQLCPSAYDPLRTNYVAGEQVTIKCHIFHCKDEEHEIYCNTNTWDDSIPIVMWKEAWEPVGKCTPTQGEVMEEEASNGVTWNC
jgi:hypothetical protein